VFTLEDFTGQGECIVFQTTYDNNKNILHNESIVSVIGRAEENGNTIKLIVEDVKPLGRAGTVRNGKISPEDVRQITIKVDALKFEPDKLYELRPIFNSTGGNCKVLFDIVRNGREHKLMELENINIRYDEAVEQALSEIFGKNNITIN
jgi:DNA polymerase-3 subunit alpha